MGYLKKTMDQGLIFKPSGMFDLDYFVNADSVGLYRYKDDQEPVSVKLCTGFLLIFAGCPSMWVSKLQTEIALSMTEAEYIVLSQSMRDLLPTKVLVQEVVECLRIEIARQQCTQWCLRITMVPLPWLMHHA